MHAVIDKSAVRGIGNMILSVYSDFAKAELMFHVAWSELFQVLVSGTCDAEVDGIRLNLHVVLREGVHKSAESGDSETSSSTAAELCFTVLS